MKRIIDNLYIHYMYILIDYFIAAKEKKSGKYASHPVSPQTVCKVQEYAVISNENDNGERRGTYLSYSVVSKVQIYENKLIFPEEAEVGICYKNDH